MPVPLPDQNVFVSYNFEANYNMPNVPADSVPGPINRLKLNPKYPAVEENGDASSDDLVARKLKDTDADADDVENEENVETTTLLSDDEEHDIHRRSLLNKIIFTRVGVYHLIENRLNA